MLGKQSTTDLHPSQPPTALILDTKETKSNKQENTIQDIKPAH
jgi:hypothetical protein